MQFARTAGCRALVGALAFVAGSTPAAAHEVPHAPYVAVLLVPGASLPVPIEPATPGQFVTYQWILPADERVVGALRFAYQDGPMLPVRWLDPREGDEIAALADGLTAAELWFQNGSERDVEVQYAANVGPLPTGERPPFGLFAFLAVVLVGAIAIGARRVTRRTPARAGKKARR